MHEQHPYNEPFQVGPRDPFESRPRQRDAQQINGAGIVGLTFSIIGLLTCGLFSPLGLGVSLVALRKEPRVAALAGVIIGLVGLLVMGVLALLMVIGVTMQGYGSLRHGAELIWDTAQIQVHINEYGSIPDSLAVLNMPTDTTIDPWGNPYVYTVYSDGKGYKVETMGPDGTYGTSDDRVLYPQ